MLKKLYQNIIHRNRDLSGDENNYSPITLVFDDNKRLSLKVLLEYGGISSELNNYEISERTPRHNICELCIFFKCYHCMPNTSIAFFLIILPYCNKNGEQVLHFLAIFFYLDPIFILNSRAVTFDITILITTPTIIVTGNAHIGLTDISVSAYPTGISSTAQS